MQGIFNNLIGKKSGKLTVVGGPLKLNEKNGAYWVCICECGQYTKKPICSNSIITEKTKSCGCLKIEMIKKANSTHKKTLTPTYISWRLMWARCTNKNHKSYLRYKDFKPIDRWKSFENFLFDMKERPIGKTLDRIDNKKGYYPENCRWADAYTQQGNTKRNIYLYLNGEKICLKAACRKLGTDYGRAKNRVKRGIDPYDAATKPKGYKFFKESKN